MHWSLLLDTCLSGCLGTLQKKQEQQRTPTTKILRHNCIIPACSIADVTFGQFTIQWMDGAWTRIWSYTCYYSHSFMITIILFVMLVVIAVTVALSGWMGRHKSLFVCRSVGRSFYVFVTNQLAKLITNNLFLSIHTIYHLVETLIGLLQYCCCVL